MGNIFTGNGNPSYSERFFYIPVTIVAFSNIFADKEGGGDVWRTK